MKIIWWLKLKIFLIKSFFINKKIQNINIGSKYLWNIIQPYEKDEMIYEMRTAKTTSKIKMFSAGPEIATVLPNEKVITKIVKKSNLLISAHWYGISKRFAETTIVDPTKNIPIIQ